MIVIENDCVDCGLPCIGNACPYRNVERHYCDRCGTECDEYNGACGYDDLCDECREDLLGKDEEE